MAQEMMGAMGALKGMMQAKNCEKQNSSVAATLDCTTAASPNYASPNCQCVRGEKSPAECQNINVNASTIKPGGINLPKVGATTPDKGGPIDLGGGDLGGPTGFKPTASTGAPPPDGGGGGAGGGAGSGNNGAQDGAGVAKRLNTNILGGGFGGGGGGGGGSAGPGYGEVDPKLKDYMPGAKNDPNRTIASQLAKEVTPEAGRSNWEKVKLRYRDNYSSLIPK
jgi:hypothetical protein